MFAILPLASQTIPAMIMAIRGIIFTTVKKVCTLVTYLTYVLFRATMPTAKQGKEW